MSLLDDLTTEIKDYPHTHLTLEIIEVEPDGININAGEEGTFTLQVANSGPLDVRNLQLVVTGLNGTQVKGAGAAAQFAGTALSNIFDLVPAHQGSRPVRMDGGRMHFLAPKKQKEFTELIEASVGDWYTDLDHQLMDHSDPDPSASTTYSDEVLPKS